MSLANFEDPVLELATNSVKSFRIPAITSSSSSSLVSTDKSSLTPHAVGLGVDAESGFFRGDFRSQSLSSYNC